MELKNGLSSSSHWNGFDSYLVENRDIYYNDPQLFGSQKTLDAIVDDISCLLRVPRRSLHVVHFLAHTHSDDVGLSKNPDVVIKTP